MSSSMTTSPSGTIQTRISCRQSRHVKELSSDSGTGGSLKRRFAAKLKWPEEVQCEEMAKQLIDMLPPSKHLTTLFSVPDNAKTSADYMEGLFDSDLESCDHQQQPSKKLSPSMLKKRIECLQQKSAAANSAHHGKATKEEFAKKKDELIGRIGAKLEVLRGEESVLKSEAKANEEVGRQITVKVMQVAQPNECEKYKSHVEEIDKITSLLLGLAGRLAKAENALLSSQHPSQKDQLVSKRDKLAEQLEEAKKLKANIDKRSTTVSAILRKYLSDQVLADYDNFIRAKARHVIDLRQINEKITVGEEQKKFLKETANF